MVRLSKKYFLASKKNATSNDSPPLAEVRRRFEGVNAPAGPAGPAQERDDSVRPLSPPPLKHFACLRVRQDEESGEAAARPQLPSLTKWMRQQQVAADPPSQRMRDVHMLHHTQLVPMRQCAASLQCGVRWDAHGRQANARRATLRQSPLRTLWPSSISISDSLTTRFHVPLRTSVAAVGATSWVGMVDGPY
jgi:hypothetical protein